MSARPLDVLHVIYDDPHNPWVGGGGARRTYDLYRHLRRDVRVTIATGAYPGAHDEVDDDRRVLRLGHGRWHPVSRLTFALAASRLLRTATYDVAVVDHSAYAPVCMPRSRPVGMIVHHLTGPVAARRWGSIGGALLARTERAALRRARVLSATSAATAQAIAPLVSPGACVEHVSSGVDDTVFQLRRSDAGYLLYVGRLDVKQKGVDLLLDAFALVLRAHPAASLRIAGRGPDEQSLRARAASLGIARAVHFLGEVSDAERDALLAGATMQVVPSRFEGFGIAAAEALAAGVPLIVTDDPALVEIVTGPERAAMVVPRADAHALAIAIAELLADDVLRARLSSAARALAERFRWQAVARDHLAFLEHVMRANDAAAGPRPR